jgi:XTP/dITP diphosphohydrolase
MEDIENQFLKFFEIVKRLRKECPWDREQTLDSIKASSIEEVYELVDAIEKKNYNELKLELADLLLHVVLYSIMAEEQNLFSLTEVLDGGIEKLVRRHPHVFGTDLDSFAKLSLDSEAVKTNWERLKFKEGRQSAVEGVPNQLPSLQRAYRLQEKASKVGFDWNTGDEVWNKVLEELNELKETFHENNIDKTEDELGDFLFALVNYSRFYKINPENALRRTNEKFIRRFQKNEKKLKENNKSIFDSNLAEMDFYWNEIKKIEREK